MNKIALRACVPDNIGLRAVPEKISSVRGMMRQSRAEADKLYLFAVHMQKKTTLMRFSHRFHPNFMVSVRHLAHFAGFLNACNPAVLVLVQLGCHFFIDLSNLVLCPGHDTVMCKPWIMLSSGIVSTC